jgi:hypothetical protein
MITYRIRCRKTHKILSQKEIDSNDKSKREMVQEALNSLSFRFDKKRHTLSYIL